MFERKYRLARGIGFLGARTIETPTFRLKILENSLAFNRFGFVVSKKVDKKAVARNSLKRRFRGCLEIFFKEIKTGHDMLFIVKKEALNKKTAELCESIKVVLKKGNFLK